MTQELKKTDIYGSFLLGDSEFAVSISHVQEVVNPPEQYSSMPLSPSYLKGLFNLRGTIIPVLDLRSMLKVSGISREEGPKVAIIEAEGIHLGLLFDATSEIFSSNDEEFCEFENKDAVISGVFNKDGGKRIVQIINVSALLKLQNIPHQAITLNQNRQLSTRAKRGQRKQCISFQVGAANCAMDIHDIQEIIEIKEVISSALATQECLGTIDLRGTIVPIIDFAAFLKYRDAIHFDQICQHGGRIIVMRLGNESFGLLVESVDNIISYFPDELISFPNLSTDKSEMFSGCISRNEGPELLLLRSDKILSSAEISRITHGHGQIYNSSKNSNAEKRAKSDDRKTYITFQMGSTYAAQIGEIKEIIENSGELLRPPGLPKLVIGALNLRGQLVTLVDGRIMYGQNPRESNAPSKILVFIREHLLYGIVVDSIDAIITVRNEEKTRLPDLLFGRQVTDFPEDILEAVEFKLPDGSRKSVLVLNMEQVSKRVQAA